MAGIWWAAAVFGAAWLALVAFGLGCDVVRFFSSRWGGHRAAPPEPGSQTQIGTDEVTAEPVGPAPPSPAPSTEV